MESPFIYSSHVTGRHFIGRKDDCAILGNFISGGNHVALISPAKSGKTSLIQQALLKIRISGSQFIVGEFNAMNIRDVPSFLKRFGSTVLRAFAVSPGEYEEIVKNYLSGTHFVFDSLSYELRDEVISLSWDIDDSDIEAMITLPFRLADEKQTNLVLIMEEFQSILHTGESDRLFKIMRGVMEDYARRESLGGRCTMVFCGSQINAMTSVFYGSPYFFRIVERFSPSEIDEREIIDYIHRGFMLSGKEIDRSLLHGICRLFRCNMWYINHFISICDSLSRGYVVESMLMEALKDILAIHESRFIATMNDLTTFQVNLLKAILDGHTKFSSADIIREYHLNTSANVKRLKEALMKKEIVWFNEKDEPVVTDPLFEYWARKYYFESDRETN